MTISKSLPLTSAEIQASLHKMGIDLSESQSDQVRIYVEVLLKWNQTLSLTTITDPHQILSRHFAESMFAAKFAVFSHSRLADVGSGAGFPGLALKILFSDLEITLIEANSRKCTFLKEVIRTLGLRLCTVHHGRLESFHVQGSKFDFVTARALGQFDSLLVWAKGALGPAGYIFLWVGAADADLLRGRSGWNWGNPVAIPGSERRILQFGHRAVLPA
jgi:16S rRNA (guanine527-N7)-methyltransferase